MIRSRRSKKLHVRLEPGSCLTLCGANHGSHNPEVFFASDRLTVSCQGCLKKLKRVRKR